MTTTHDAHGVALDWLRALGDRLSVPGSLDLGELVRPDGWWRDLLTFTWDLRSFIGIEAVHSALTDSVAEVCPRGFALTPGSPVEHVGGDVEQIIAWFDFDTTRGPARGFVRLLAE